MFKIVSFFKEGHPRTLKAKKNIIVSFFCKGMDLFLGFYLIAIILNYLHPEKYGIWLTILSMVNLFSFLNVGLGHGFRNKFAESLSEESHKKAKTYVSTTYAMITLLMGGFILLFIFINQFIPWSQILNSHNSLSSELYWISIIIFISFFIKMILDIVITMTLADQRSSIKDIFNFLSKLLIFIFIFFLVRNTDSSLLYLSLIYSIIPVVVLCLFSFYFFRYDYKDYAPSIHYVDFKYGKDIFSLGFKFFILQLSVIILFISDNIIISQIFGPSEVTPYQIAHRYFSVFLILFTIIISPMWSAYTEAFSRNDYKWISSIIRKQERLWYILLFGVLLMFLASEYIYVLWIGDTIIINTLLSALWAIFILLQTQNMIYTHFLNGVGKIKIQIITALIASIINIPLSVLFALYFNLGVSGVILATNVCILFYLIVRKIQYKRIISNTAQGIWNE